MCWKLNIIFLLVWKVKKSIKKQNFDQPELQSVGTSNYNFADFILRLRFVDYNWIRILRPVWRFKPGEHHGFNVLPEIGKPNPAGPSIHRIHLYVSLEYPQHGVVGDLDRAQDVVGTHAEGGGEVVDRVQDRVILNLLQPTWNKPNNTGTKNK